MTEYNMYEAKTNLSKICRLLEEKKEDMIIISRNGKPVLKVTLFDQNPRSSLFGSGKGLFTIPENFDDIDISDDFEEEIFPR
ncbi:MAG: hypothetical protein IJI75_12215 [Solobacterium sp.]|nr:hypothetical protein [Solobacterium sp.]